MSAEVVQLNPRAITLAEAVQMGPDKCGAYLPDMLSFKPEDVEQATKSWLFLCDVPASSKRASWLRREVETDHVLLVALMSPAHEFSRWFNRRLKLWPEFAACPKDGSSFDWGFAVTARAREACADFDDIAMLKLSIGDARY
jgi:hypothetical protein